MVIRVTLKDPDAMHDAVDHAIKWLPVPDGVTAAEWVLTREARADRIKAAISSKWMEYGEYLVVEFTVTEAGEPVSAVVLDVGAGGYRE